MTAADRPRWQLRDVPLRFQLGDWTLLRVGRRLQVRQVQLAELPAPLAALAPPDQPELPHDALAPGSEGFLIRALPLAAGAPPVQRIGGYLCYVQSRYPHYFVDLGGGFERYKAGFSSRSRSTIQRKVRRFAEHCGGTIDCRGYRTPQEMTEFFALARSVSQKTYQEKILDAGLPEGPGFQREMQALAAAGAVRAWLLFDAGKPVSYLYCPAEGETLIYAYLGYDPAYLKLSVGTVLQWLALEALFGEAETQERFRLFDFTEGEAEHKRLFSTGSVPSANVLFLRDSIANRALVRAHLSMDRFSGRLGDALARWGLKARLKRLLRASA